MRILIAAAVLLGTSCAVSASFKPKENVTAESSTGQPAASYQISAQPGKPAHVHVTVWSDGGYLGRDGMTYVDAALDVRNTAAEAIVIDPHVFALEPFNRDGSPGPTARLVRVIPENGTFVVPPKTAATVRAKFVLPSVSLERLSALRLRWGIAHEGGEQYVQYTEFEKRPPRIPNYMTIFHPVFGFYDPYVYEDPFVVHRSHLVPVGRTVAQDHDRSRSVAQR